MYYIFVQWLFFLACGQGCEECASKSTCKSGKCVAGYYLDSSTNICKSKVQLFVG